MTLSLLMYALMITTAATLVAVLVVDLVRGLRHAPARRLSAAAARTDRTRSARSRGAAPTTS